MRGCWELLWTPEQRVFNSNIGINKLKCVALHKVTKYLKLPIATAGWIIELMLKLTQSEVIDFPENNWQTLLYL